MKGLGMINRERLWNRLFELSRIGRQEQGGITRFSFTKEEREAKELVTSYMKEAGLSVREDAVGNLIGRKEGRKADAPTVLIGSHIDTVPNGGMFDGALGVLAGIEVLQSMKEQGIETAHPIEVIVFTDEEGARFGFGMIGSRAVAGTLKREELEYTDPQGITVAQAMRQAGFDPDRISDAYRKPGSIKAYIELHIEQGKVLENHHLPVGIVSGIAGPLWLKWTLTGEAGHAGATPMKIRRDPVIPAAKIIQYIEEETRKYPNAVATIGKITVKPGGINVIPNQIEFTLDLRDIDETVRDRIEQKIVDYARHICKERGVEFSITPLQRVAPAPCSPEIRQVMERVFEKMGLTPLILPSGAGHDGMQLKDLCPIGMIFVRSKDGVSHTPAEWSSKEDCGIGTEVLYHTVLQLAEV